MTNEELKKKIVDVLRGNIEYELHYFPDDNYTEVEFDYDKLADVLLSAGFISLKASAEMAREACDILRHIKDDEIKCICKERGCLCSPCRGRGTGIEGHHRGATLQCLSLWL